MISLIKNPKKLESAVKIAEKLKCYKIAKKDQILGKIENFDYLAIEILDFLEIVNLKTESFNETLKVAKIFDFFDFLEIDYKKHLIFRFSNIEEMINHFQDKIDSMNDPISKFSHKIN